MRGLVHGKIASEVSDLVQSLEADLKLVGSLGRASPLFEDAVDEVDVDRAGQYHEDVIVRVRDRIPLSMQVRVGVGCERRTLTYDLGCQ